MSISYCDQCEHIVEGNTSPCLVCGDELCECGGEITELSEDADWR